MWKITNLYAIVAIVTIGGLLQGFDISSLSAILGTKAFNTHYGKANSSTQGGITASISGGSFMGCHGAFLLIDRIGRRAVLQVGCLIFIVGAVLCTASVDIAMLIVGRFVCGFAVGRSFRIESDAPISLLHAPRNVHFCRSYLSGRNIPKADTRTYPVLSTVVDHMGCTY